MGKGVENEQSCPGLRSWARGDLFWEAHSPCPPLPLRTRPAPPPPWDWTPFPGTLLPCGGSRGSGRPSQTHSPPAHRHHGWDGHHPCGGPLQITITFSSGALMLWGIQPEGQSCWSPRTGPQDHADLLREPLRHAHQHQPCRLHNAGPALPASSIRPGCRPRGELAAPTSVTGSLRTSNVTPGQFGGQWLSREAPRTPDA